MSYYFSSHGDMSLVTSLSSFDRCNLLIVFYHIFFVFVIYNGNAIFEYHLSFGHCQVFARELIIGSVLIFEFAMD